LCILALKSFLKNSAKEIKTERFIEQQTLAEYDTDKLNDFEFAIYDVYENREEKDKIAKLFEKLRKHIDKAQEQIINESKTYL